ncbi:distal tail protein Dit [Streptococcus xiaochunlingii]|uniref:Phage tail protein n=1 Tax=Streptococcus xiaochunlingii TaxID=2589788 RepID=A0ABY2YCT2_9STRE|nr:distal tail protein Dit [Streptococcus xiaochunlingii]TPE36683.1 phage tail protein [Streptococcus xiaochunlingii]
MNNDTIIFNGFDLSKVIRIIEIIRPVGNERSITTNNAPRLGVNLQEVRTGPKIIKVKFAMQFSDGVSLEQAKHTLAGVFKTNEAVKITISDEPDKYYMGLISGSVNMDNVTRWFQKGELEILIPDGVAHSSTYRRFENGTASGDKITFDLINNGNDDAVPVITVKNNSENGYIGLVNVNGALEVGDREEADTEQYRRSEVLFDYRDSKITTGLSQAQKNVAVLNDTSQNLKGTVGIDNAWGRPHLALTSRGSGPQPNNAGSLSWTIPADSSGATGSLNDYIWWRQVFWLGAANEFGFIKLTVSDDQGQFLYGVETFKRYNGLGCEYNFMASNGRGGYNMVKQWSFTGTHWDYHNPFNEPRGWSDIKRNDDQVTVFWWGGYNTFTIPEIKGRKSAKIHVAFGALGNKPLVTHMYLDSIYYQKDFVSATRDVPNRYPMGSNVILDCENDTVIVDGIERVMDIVHGSNFITIPPGNSKLEVYCSSWARVKPSVKVEFRERYL